MTWRHCQMWLVRAVVMTASVSMGPPGDLPPWSGPGVVSAAEDPVWELQPYRIRVLFCADGSPLWTGARLDKLTSDIPRRAAAEYGRVWQLTVEMADAEVRRAALSAGDTTVPSLPPDVQEGGDTDKCVCITLRATTGEPTVETFEYDVTSDRWNRGPLRTIGPWNRLTQAVFESLAETVTPLAVVKTVADDRVVLRVRGGLLPIRNPRRPLAAAGSIFQMAERGVLSDGDVSLPAGYLVVERVDGHLLECHAVGGLSSLSGPDVADRFMAVGVRSPHAATQFTFRMAGSPATVPLAGCDVSLSDTRDTPGVCLGRTDDEGRIVVAATQGVRWLHVSLGAVRLEQFPVVPGWRMRQAVTTRISAATLATAAAVRDCHNDLAELAAIRNTYLARCKSRERAGRTAEAQSLREEGQKVIEQRAPALRQRISQRRQRVEQLYPDQADAAQLQWEALEQLVSKLSDPIRE